MSIGELKEILDRLKDSVNNPIIDVPVMGGVSEPIDNSQCLEPNECKIVLDYITNLEQENEKLNLKNEIIDMLSMIYKSYGVLNHYQVELLEDTLQECLRYLEDKNEKNISRC